MSPVHQSREAIESGQLAHLRALLGRLVPANRFYSAKFALAGVDPSCVSLEDFSNRFPFTTKQQIVEDQRAFPPYGSNLTFSIDQYLRYHQTSGTTGAPVRWLDTKDDWESMLLSWGQVLHAAGVAAKDRVFFAFSFGPFIGFWLAFEAAAKLGCLCLPGGGLSSVGRLRCILDNEVTILCCTPTYAQRLAQVAREEKIDLARGQVRRIIVAGEPGGSIPATRAQIEDLWPGAKVFDHHGMTEVGPVTFECPAGPGILHVIEDAYYPEVVNPETGNRCGLGERGELVLTTLTRIGSPLLRYRTGDIVAAAEGRVCVCGRSELSLVGGILGRVDDMVVVRGINVFPSAIEAIIRSFPEISEYQATVSQGMMGELAVAIELAVGVASLADIEKRLETTLQSAFNLRIPVTRVAPGSLPRFDMKSRRWIKL